VHRPDPVPVHEGQGRGGTLLQIVEEGIGIDFLDRIDEGADTQPVDQVTGDKVPRAVAAWGVAGTAKEAVVEGEMREV